MRKQTINIAQAINVFERQSVTFNLETNRILKKIFFKLAREISEESGAYRHTLVEDEILEFNAGVFTMCIDWTNITITNNLTNETCDLMSYTNVGKVCICYFIS